MKLNNGARRWTTLAGATVALTVATMAFASGAYATSATVFTGTSPQGGWGSGIWRNGSSSTRTIEACDQGNPDGRRTVAILEVGGAAHEIHAFSGTGICSGQAPIPGLTAGSAYRFRACLRNGANGANVFCSPWVNGTVS